VKTEIFSEKPSFRNLGPRKFVPSPQTRRQVSATDHYYNRLCQSGRRDIPLFRCQNPGRLLKSFAAKLVDYVLYTLIVVKFEKITIQENSRISHNSKND